MPLEEQEALELVEEVEARYSEVAERVDERRKLYHNDPDADPILPKPYDVKYPFQSQRPNRVGAQYVSRLDENRFTLNGTGHQGESSRQNASDRVAQYIYNGLISRELQLGYTLQRALAMGQARDMYGVLHWLKADDLLPPVQDRETDESRQKSIAEAGFPWWVEVPDPVGVMPIPDRSPKPGFGAVVVRRRVASLRYIRERRENDGVMTIPANLPIGMERDAPGETDPSGSGWKGIQTMYQIWTRDEWTEILKEGKKVEVFAGDKHPYRMPPFAIAPAIYNHHPDPVYNYEPRLNSMFRLKKNLDYAMALFFAAAEWGMLPYWYLESVTDGSPMLTGEDGQLMIFDRQNVGSAKIPKGYTLKPLNHEIAASFVEGLRILTEEYEIAQPSTGRASFDSGSPQPWSVRLEQAQESVEPNEDLDAIRNALQVCVDNIRMVHGLPVTDGGFGEPMSVYAMDKNGRRDASKLITVKPEDFRSTIINVDISNTSSAERIADIQHGLELLNNPRTKVTPRFFLDNIMRVGNAAEMIAEYDGYELFETVVKPATQRQLIVAKIGHIVRVGPDGMLVGNDGQVVSDEQAIAAAGGQVEPVGNPNAQGMTPQSQEGGESLPALSVPGAGSIPGIR